MKIPTSIWKWQNKRLSIMKIMVLLWSTSVVKRIVTLSLLSFSLFFIWAFSLFLLPLSLFLFSPESHPDLWGNHSLHHPFLTWDNALKMMIITLLFSYNSTITTQYLEQNMTLCECLRRCTGICNESRVTCMKNYEGGLATNTMSTTWSCKEQYDNDGACHNKRNSGKLHDNISRNGYGNAIIGRYGGCFEEGK